MNDKKANPKSDGTWGDFLFLGGILSVVIVFVASMTYVTGQARDHVESEEQTSTLFETVAAKVEALAPQQLLGSTSCKEFLEAQIDQVEKSLLEATDNSSNAQTALAANRAREILTQVLERCDYADSSPHEALRAYHALQLARWFPHELRNHASFRREAIRDTKEALDYMARVGPR